MSSTYTFGLGLTILALVSLLGWVLYTLLREEQLEVVAEPVKPKKKRQRATIAQKLMMSGVPGYKSRYGVARLKRWIARHGDKRQRRLLAEIEVRHAMFRGIKEQRLQLMINQYPVEPKFMNRGPRERYLAHLKFHEELQAQMAAQPSKTIDPTPLPVTFGERVKALFTPAKRAA